MIRENCVHPLLYPGLTLAVYYAYLGVAFFNCNAQVLVDKFFRVRGIKVVQVKFSPCINDLRLQ